MSQDAFSFVMYIIHSCARRWGRTPAQTYRSLKESGCIDGFLVPNYDILHTQSSDYVVSNVEDYLQARGVRA